MNTSRLVTELVEQLRLHEGGWSKPQAIGVSHSTVSAGWRESDDPFSMLLLCAAIHPGRHPAVALALTTAMSFIPYLQREHDRQIASQGNYNGPSRFSFIHLAQRVRQAVSEFGDDERGALSRDLCDAIRAIVADPFELPAADSS